MNPQNNNSQQPNSFNQNQQNQFPIPGAGNSNQMQDGTSISSQNGVTPTEREAMLARMGTFLQGANGVPKDKIATIARNLENQCFQSSPSQQQYVISCSNILNQLTNTLLQKNFNPQMQFQQANQLNATNSSQNMQIPNVRPFQFPLHQGQNLQAQQLQKQMQMGSNMQFPQQFSNTLQPDQMNELQRRKALAQLQNMGMSVPNQGNFNGNSLLQGALNTPNLGRPRPAQQPIQSAAGNPGSNLAQNLGIPAPGQQVRPGAGNQPSQITPQMIMQFAQSPAFPAFASSRGLTLLQAKNLLLEQANSINNSNTLGAANLSNLIPKADSTPNLVNNGMNSNLQAAGSLLSRPGLVNPALNMTNPQNQKLENATRISQMGAPLNPSMNPANNTQLQGNPQANLLAQKQMEALEAAKSNPNSNLPPGMNVNSFKLTPANAFTIEEIQSQNVLKVIEVAKLDLEPKLKNATDSFKAGNIVEASPEERAEIMEFLQNSPLMIKTIEVLIPLAYLITKNLELPKLLVLFKHMICEQLKVLPNLILALPVTKKITIQIYKSMELVRQNLARFPKDMPAPGSNSVPGNISNNGHITNTSLSNTANNANQVTTISQNPSTSNISQAGPISSENPQATILGSLHNKSGALPATNMQKLDNISSNANNNASEPAQDFKHHISNHELSLKLPPQKGVSKLIDPGLKNQLQASNINSSPLKPLVKADRLNQVTSSDGQVVQSGVKRSNSLFNISGLKPNVSAQLLSSEKEIAQTRSQFKGQALAYATSAFKELNASRQDPSFKRAKNSPGEFKIHITPDLYHYDLSESLESDSLFSFSNYRQGTNIRGFGDLIPQSKQSL